MPDVPMSMVTVWMVFCASGGFHVGIGLDLIVRNDRRVVGYLLTLLGIAFIGSMWLLRYMWENSGPRD